MEHQQQRQVSTVPYVSINRCLAMFRDVSVPAAYTGTNADPGISLTYLLGAPIAGNR